MPPKRHGLGILGGTFDPPHIGHLAAAVEVRSALGLDRILLMVANDPWQKSSDRVISSAEDRFALTCAAVDGIEGLEASDLEIRRGGPSYTVDTLEELRSQDPSSELFLIVGADAASGLHTWHDHASLPGLATLVIVSRLGEADGDGDGDDLIGWNVERITMPRLDVSSSELRARIVRGAPVVPYLPESVVDEIERRGMYGLRDS